MITQKSNLNMIPSGTPVKVYCDQGDKNLRELCFTLMKDSNLYLPEMGATATVEGTKPDGGTFSHTAELTGSNATVTLYEDMADVAGDTLMQVVLHEGDNRTGSQMIILSVQRSAYI